MTNLPTKAERYDTLAALYADERFTNGHSDIVTRRFIEAVYWAYWTTGGSSWSAIGAALGMNPREADYHWGHVLREDAPRWEPSSFKTGCVHVLESGPRRGEKCGKSGLLRGRITCPETGQWEEPQWCSKHREPGRVALFREGQRDKSLDPEPHPNRGGLLPCYLNPKRRRWADFYREASFGGRWREPRIGVCADDWPTLEKVHLVVRRPKLTLILGDAS